MPRTSCFLILADFATSFTHWKGAAHWLLTRGGPPQASSADHRTDLVRLMPVCPLFRTAQENTIWWSGEGRRRTPDGPLVCGGRKFHPPSLKARVALSTGDLKPAAMIIRHPHRTVLRLDSTARTTDCQTDRPSGMQDVTGRRGGLNSERRALEKAWSDSRRISIGYQARPINGAQSESNAIERRMTCHITPPARVDPTGCQGLRIRGW